MSELADKPLFNLELASAVLQFAKAPPANFKFNMDYWWDKEHVDDKICTTSACLAGAAVHLSPRGEIILEDRFSPVNPAVDGNQMSWDDAGALLLGLSEDEAELLFHITDDRMAIALLEAKINGGDLQQEYDAWEESEEEEDDSIWPN